MFGRFYSLCSPRQPSARLPAYPQAWFKNVGQMGQRAQGWHTQTFVERSRFLRHDGRWLYGECHRMSPWLSSRA